MSVSLTYQELNNEKSDTSTENEDEDGPTEDDAKNVSQIKLDLSISIDNRLDDKEVTKVQNTTIMPQDLRKSYKMSKFKNQIELDVEQRSLVDNSSKSSSWKHSDVSTDDDVYTITAAVQTLHNPSLQITSIDGFFNRKRGRPPKNRFVEVYKNTHQKPQAIFTSFKLEKQGGTAESAPNYEDFLNYSQQTGVEALRGCDGEYRRHKPFKTNSTQRKRLHRANATSSAHIGSSSSFIEDQISQCNENSQNLMSHYEKGENNYLPFNTKNDLNFSASSFNGRTNIVPNSASKIEESFHPSSFEPETGAALKKQKLCGTTDNVTVIRATGTFYPENSNENSRDFEKSCDTSKYKKIPDTYSDIEVAQNLSLKDTPQSGTECLPPSSSSSASIMTASAFVLPQIYNALHMQQQLFAFYQQMALITPAFSNLDQKQFLTPILTQASEPPTSSPTASCSSSVDPVAGSVADLSYNKDLVNMILNLQTHQDNQKNSPELNSLTISKYLMRQSHKKTLRMNPKTTTTAKVTHRSQTKTPLAQPTPAQTIPQAHFEYDRERTPSGYLRFRFNEDCGYQKCGYRQHQSHFHCNRSDCQYSFCDKTRFVQHTARHERLDTLMGSDFQQYRTTTTCNFPNCPYAFNTEDLNDILNARKSSHFHCLKCPFVCADTNKVVAHRRLHNKLEFIRSAGFRKVTSKENCLISTIASDSTEPQPTNLLSFNNGQFDVAYYSPPNEVISRCPYAMRHTHYHCLICNCSVLSRSQLLAHKHRYPDTSNTVRQQRQ